MGLFNIIKSRLFKKPAKRSSVEGMLQHARKVGFKPECVIDVGAAQGVFASMCYAIFPEAQYILIEPLEENRIILEHACRKIGRAIPVMAAAGKAEGEAAIQVVKEHLDSSTLYFESGGGIGENGRMVHLVTLDQVARQHGVTGQSILLKADVQGAELDVLSGATEILRSADYVMLEASLFRFMKGIPDLYDIEAFMRGKGFVVYDLSGMRYRPLDDALAQVDVVFVKEESQFRLDNRYATPEQWSRVSGKFEKKLKRKKSEAGRE